MREMLRALVTHLKNHRNDFTRGVQVVTECYDPTYGLSNGTAEIPVVDVDALLRSIDEFSETFDNGGRHA